DVWFGQDDEGVKMYDACFVGRIDPNKGITTLFGAWNKVVKARPDAKLLVVGDAWPGTFPIYYKQIEDLQISKNVVFAGYLPDEVSIRKLLHSSKLFVLPTKLEGFSRSALEAMASGLPCILGDIPTLKEIFGEAVTYIQVENQEALSEAILNLLDDVGKREELMRRSVSLAKGFTWKIVAARTLNIMNSTLPERKRLPS
ncbi:MAG: glycosyltransferase, partial [Nitrososphaerales archaeon]